ncbi:PIN domain-containing protein [Bifidobacterium criceti]|uniref:Toxin-antitoxin system, toxin component, PIN family n=1 Tax=Bifidobacterium criceti TaxID=1960969 RepID=A0A2A2ECX4_9BIFI|nr:PIN domain-containing protein [Bifidobacterium criceti]PAU66853.1 toxin-antitoxin system, toxin component, PIN family [Bifidobacterium criceti]
MTRILHSSNDPDVTGCIVGCEYLPHIWLTDVLLTFADFGIFFPIFSEDVLQEAERALICTLGKPRQFATAYIDQIRTIDAAYVVSSSPALPGTMVIPDIDDRHVVAAAHNGDAAFIVTFNLKDFPNEELGKIGLTALHPDTFLVRLVSQCPTMCSEALRYLVDSKKNPPRTMAQELDHLARTAMPKFAAIIRTMQR